MRPRSLLLSAHACVLVACGPGASGDPGVGLPLRVPSAQLAEGPLPAESGGPEITFLEQPASRVRPGDSRVLLGGRTGPTGYSVHLGLDGGDHHWILPVGLPDSVALEELTWSARLDFSGDLEPGDVMIALVAVDGQGRAGPTARARFELLSEVPPGPLAIALTWDRQVDLDLHIQLPDGAVIGPKNINSYEPPAPGRPPAAPDAWMSGGRIDVDSNAGCVIDGQRTELAYWSTTPPAGTYVVFADLAQACGEPVVSFRATAYRDGVEVRSAAGTLYDFDTRQHPALPGGATGLRLMELEVQ